VQDDTEEGIVDLNLAVVLDEAQFPEFVHEEIDSGPRRANHLRQHLLRHCGKSFVRMARRAIAREQQQSARQALLAGVEKLVYEVRLHSNVSALAYKPHRKTLRINHPLWTHVKNPTRRQHHHLRPLAWRKNATIPSKRSRKSGISAGIQSVDCFETNPEFLF
jgi:hypothetical protein